MKNRFNKSILFILTVGLTTFLSIPCNSQEIRATAKLDTTRILLGDQINLLFLLEHPEGLKVVPEQV